VKHMSLQDFESRYQAERDPWGYETSAYERAKYDATLRACGPGPYARALELGSSIGVLSAELAPRCSALVTIDGAPTAVADARRRLAGADDVEVILGRIPDDIPDGPYDLVVASEILYYLPEDAFAATLSRIRDQMRFGARLVAVHWRKPGAERPFSAAEVHDYLRGAGWLVPLGRADTAGYLLDVLERR
jgi:cyclopropane fatty-acyl-phospholipid synthase-like methyltransferase